MKKFILILSALSLGACSGDGDSDSGSTSASLVGGAITTVSSVMSKVVPDTSGVTAASLAVKTSVTSEYEDTDYGIGGDYGTTPKAFLQRQGDKTQQGGLMYRFNQAVNENLCMFSYFLPSTSGVIDLQATASTIEITSAMVTGSGRTAMQTACPDVTDATLDYLDTNAPVTIGYKVEDYSAVSGSEYERKISFDATFAAPHDQFDDVFLYTINSSLVKFIYVETNASNSGNDKGSYHAFNYDITNELGQYEYHSFNADTVDRHDVYRAFYDGNNNFSAYLARSNASTKDIVMVASTPTSSATDLAVSFDITATSSLSDGNACISNSTLAVATDNSLACGVTGMAASGFSAVTNFTSKNKASFAAIDETFTIQFSSSSNFLTSGPLQ